MGETVNFLSSLRDSGLKTLERSVAAIWYNSRTDHARPMTVKQIVQDTEAAGYSRPNQTRLARDLAKDRRTAKVGPNQFRIRINARSTLDRDFAEYLIAPAAPPSDSVVPRELVGGTRGYIERVVHQVNASYDLSLFDCCAVMARRLLETLLLEVFEAHGVQNHAKGGDGHYMMFSGLLSVLKTSDIEVGRGATKGLQDFKRLGDQSAHNRRFNARRNDIDRVRDGLRLAVEELVHLAKLA